MDDKALDSIEKIRQQFDSAPYPNVALDMVPSDIKILTLFNIVTAYYQRYQKVVDTKDKVILDAGCGSGYESLALAIVNPGAKIVGVDLSKESAKLAEQRLYYHGFKNVEFHALSIYDLPKLGMEFDYIHCNEVLYLIPDIVAALKAMKSVLKPEGIIRTNLHSAAQRYQWFRAQKLFELTGFMDNSPGELEIAQVRETMKALKDDVILKARTWRPAMENEPEWYLANYLLQGDRGYTIPELFAALKATDLEFIGMVNWHQWDVLDLFKDSDDIPAYMAVTLPELSVEERLHLFELLHPVHRLLDFWCGHPNVTNPPVPVDEWTESDWRGAQVYIHSNLTAPKVKQEMLDCAANIKMFEFAKYLPFAKDPNLLMDSTVASCLVALLEGSQSMMSLVQRWQQLRPVHPVTLEPTDEQAAFETVRQILTKFEPMGLVLLER